MRRFDLMSWVVMTVLLSACGGSHPEDAGEPDAGCGGGFVYCSPAFGTCCTDASYQAVCVRGVWSCDFPPVGFDGTAHLSTECGSDAMSLIGAQGYDVAHALCYATGPIDAGVGDPACGTERPTCSELFGRCCTGSLSPASCTGGAWTCDTNQVLTSECSFDLSAAVRREYGPQRAEDFCYPSGDAGVGDAAVADAGSPDAAVDGG